MAAPIRVLSRGTLRASFLRFLIVGAINTALTGLLIVVIAKWMDIQLAYTIVFMVGLAFTTAMAGPFVFHARLTGRALRRFVSWYLCVYLLGVTVVHIAEHQLHISHVWIAAAVIAVTAPLNFLGGRRAFVTGATMSPQAERSPSTDATHFTQGSCTRIVCRKDSVSASAAGVPISKKRSRAWKPWRSLFSAKL
jgi:putative flippase GtrA